MATPTLAPVEDRLDEEWYEDEVQLFAYDSLARACRSEAEGEDPAEAEARCHASCL